MNETNERASDQQLGERLRLAREAAKLTQASAAALIGVARTTIVAIEQGLRHIRLDELQKLASAYGTSANFLLRREAVLLDLVPRFRKLPQGVGEEVEVASRLLNDLVRAEVELENALGVLRSRNYPPERPVLPGDVRAQAEHDAQDLRDWLGLGPGPVIDIVPILELQLGIRVYVRQMDSHISGLFAFDDVAGACIVLNAKHPRDRMTQTAGHELGHFVSSRRQVEALTEEERFLSRGERYADSFARGFLTPARAVRQLFADITAGQLHLTRRHVILLSSAFGVSREAMVRRLEELALARGGTWDWFQANGGITADQVRQVLGEPPERSMTPIGAQGLVPPRLALLAREAWKRGIYSEGQLARLLELDRHGVREVLAGAEHEESEADEIVELLH